MAQIAELQAQKAQSSYERKLDKDQKAADKEEKADRETLIAESTIANKNLQKALDQARKALIKAQQDAAGSKRDSELASFAQSAVENSLQSVRTELVAAREQLSRMQSHAKVAVDREREHVQRLQRELASTKEMLRVSQKAQMKNSERCEMSGPDVILAAREQIFVSWPCPALDAGPVNLHVFV